MDFEVAIPSYQRVKKLKTQTLPFLERVGIPRERITIFLKNIEEANVYVPEISGYRFKICNNKNIWEKRNFIIDYYPIGQKVLGMDDDIQDVKFLDETKDFISVVNRMFKLCEEQNCSTFGFYPITTSNNFYLKERVASGLQYICWALYGFINRGVKIPEEYMLIDDRWWSCYWYRREGKTLRYEGASIKTVYFSSGGMSEIRSQKQVEPVLKLLEKEYPECVKFQVKRNGRPDVVFKRIQREFLELYNQDAESDGTE